MRPDKFISLWKQAIKHTPLYGRTIAVLWFLCLVIKQIILLVTTQPALNGVLWSTKASNYLSFIVSDALVILIIIFLVVVNVFIKKKIRRLFVNVVQLIVLTLFVIDCIAWFLFQSRMSWFDIGSGILDLSIVHYSPLLITEVVMVVIAIGLIFLWIQSKVFKKYQKLLLAVWCSIFALSFFFASMFSQGPFHLPDNIISSDIKTTVDLIRDESNRQVGNPSVYKSYFGNIPWQGKKPNIIVVFAESFSAIDSKRVGGINDNLPYFDKIQAEGMTFTNFLANGCTSDTAHVALLQWIEPRKFSRQQENVYTGYKLYTEPLPQFAEGNWYHTVFLSTASIEFLGQDLFLSGVWFTTIIADNIFADQKKYVFDAAPDQVLYDKTLQTLPTEKAPYLVVLQTISSHRPYDTPYGKSEAAAFRYMDKSLYYFYEQLKKSWFFDNGLLIIVGDHRKMEPAEKDEQEKLWSLRYGKALLTVVGTGIIPGTINNTITQHTDIFYSIQKLIGQWQVKVNKFFNDIFSSSKGRDWGVIFCRYFTKRYGILTTNTSGTAFEYINDVKTAFPKIYSYIKAYNGFQDSASSWTTYTTPVSNKNMIIIAHRGSHENTTENSLEAFQLAQKNGANGVEFDVSQTKDGKNIVMHWPSMYPTTCGVKTLVATHDLAWLQEHCPLTNGEKIRTLEDMLTQLSGMFQYYFVEIKAYTPNVQQQTLDAIQTVKKLWMQDNVIFTSYDKTATFMFGDTQGIHAGRDTFDTGDIDVLPDFRNDYYLMPLENVTKNTALQIAKMGKKFVVYVVNTRDDLEKLYDEWVRIIMTDKVIQMKENADKLVLEQK